MSAKELAHVVRLHPSTVTGVLQRLVQKRLLAREVDPGDTRRVRLFVRPEAKKFARRASGTVESAIAQALSTASPKDVASARRVLGVIAASLGQTGE
jgi:DNA-binding MarR family transcriptional regulator